LSTALHKALAVESVGRATAGGGDVIDMGQAEFAAYVRADTKMAARGARGNIVVE